VAAQPPRTARRLGAPVPIAVDAAPRDGRPLRVGALTVEAIRESWLVEDRWWTTTPLRRRYWEVVTTCGRDLVVFRDLQDGRWWRQR
jgi:hypothetical protein